MSLDPVMQKGRIVIIGAGQAGFSASAKLRALGFDGQLALIGDEAHPPYQRPPLSKAYLLGEMEEERLYLRPLDYYRQHDIDLHLANKATRINRQERAVHLSDGNVLAYDRLILTTGACPRQLPPSQGGDLQGVYYVRNLADINRMASHFQAGKHVLIVGGGYIGLEIAAIATKFGLKVTLIEAQSRILQRVASSQTADYFRELHLSKGVALRENTKLAKLIGNNGHVCAVQMEGGEQISVNFVIAGIGIVPNVALACQAGLEVDNGIIVDEYCQTSDPAISAAGDCASFPWRGERVRLENVGNAIDGGEAVARIIMGEQLTYQAKPWFWSDQFDVKLQIAGLSQGYDHVTTRVSSTQALSHWYYCGDKLLAVDAMNDPRVYMVAKRLIDAGKSPPAALIGNPETDLRSLL